MNILKVEFHPQDGWESLKTFRFWMWAFGGFAPRCGLRGGGGGGYTGEAVSNHGVAGASGERDVGRKIGGEGGDDVDWAAIYE